MIYPSHVTPSAGLCHQVHFGSVRENQGSGVSSHWPRSLELL